MPHVGGEGAARPAVLVVDDNSVNCELLARRLERDGLSITSTLSGEEALELAHPERFHLVLLDIMMPGIGGLDVLETLRARFSAQELPIIMVTARDRSEDVVRSLELGANDHVSKPIDFPVLRARMRTQLRLRELAKIRDEFFRVASHDLKNPLTTLVWGADALERTMRPGEPVTDAHLRVVEKLRGRAREMTRIIKDLLDFEALEGTELVLRRSSIDLNELAREAVENNALLSEGKGIALSAELEEGLPRVEADPARLAQVLDNLVGNAVKFGRPGDSAVLRTHTDGESARVEVSDTGPGILAEDAERLFVAFGRLGHAPTGGESSTGLGLAICKRIVERHGGTLGARPNAGPGATFWFSLPLGSRGGAG